MYAFSLKFSFKKKKHLMEDLFDLAYVNLNKAIPLRQYIFELLTLF